MISFGLRNFHPVYTPNCQRPRFDRTRRSVDTLARCKFIIFLPHRLYRLAVSVSITGSSLGAIVSASYSTFCNVSLSIIAAFLTIISRRQKACIRNRDTSSLFGFFRCSFFAHYTPTFILAVHTIDWSITWFVCWGWGYRRHLQTRRKRPSYGYIHFSTSFSKVGFQVNAGF